MWAPSPSPRQWNGAGRDKGTKCPPDELIKHLFNGFHLMTKTRLARTTGRAGMNLGDKSAWVHLRLTLGLRADKRATQLGNSFGRSLFIIQSEGRERRRRGEASPQRKARQNTLWGPQWRMNYSGSAARPQPPGENGRFHLQNVPFWFLLKNATAIHGDNGGLGNPFTYIAQGCALAP